MLSYLTYLCLSTSYVHVQWRTSSYRIVIRNKIIQVLHVYRLTTTLFHVNCHRVYINRCIMSTAVSDCFTIGSIVATRTCYNENIEGEVLAFDPQTKMLILKCPSSSGNPKRHDVNIVNLSLVSDVQIKKEVTTVPEPPQSLNLHRLNTRVRNSIENKRRLVSALSACLDPEGQRLFMAIARVIDDVSWAGQNIRVYNEVIITPPYKVDNVIGEKDSKPYNYIKKFVERHWRDHRDNIGANSSQHQ